MRVTIHAGEADGPSSIADALDCGAERIGHGVRLLEDIDGAAPEDASGPVPGSDTPVGAVPDPNAPVGAVPDPNAPTRPTSDPVAPSAHFGPTAERVHREQVCLEVCPSSNLQTGAAADLASHPVGPLHRFGFSIALSSDNRLMSRTRTSREMLLAAQAFDWSLADLEQIVLTGLDAGFAPAAQRQALRDEVVLPAFRAVGSADHNA